MILSVVGIEPWSSMFLGEYVTSKATVADYDPVSTLYYNCILTHEDTPFETLILGQAATLRFLCHVLLKCPE